MLIKTISKKAFTSTFVFLIVLIVFSLGADFCFLGRNTIDKEGMKGWGGGRPDFRVYWSSSRDLYRQSIAPVKSPARREILKKKRPVYDKKKAFYHFRYSPLIALAFVPIGRMNYPSKALLLWLALVNIAYLSAVFILFSRLFRDFDITDIERSIIRWVVFLGTARYYLMILGQGQIDTLIALFLVLFLLAYLDGREILCGIILAFILQMKLLFFPALVYFMIRGKFRIIVSTLISFVIFLFLPAFILGFKETVALLKDWGEILSVSVTSQLMNFKNQSIAYGVSVLLFKNSYIKDNIEPKNLVYPLSVFFMTVSYVLLAWLRKHIRNLNEIRNRYVEVAALIVISVLFAPTSWEAYFINLIVPLGVTMLFIFKTRNKTLPYTVLGVYFFLSCAIGTDITKYIPVVRSLRFINISIGTVFLAIAMIYSYVSLEERGIEEEENEKN